MDGHAPRATRRTTANFVAFLEQVEIWSDPAVERVYAILDHLHAHRATDVLLFARAPLRAGSSSRGRLFARAPLRAGASSRGRLFARAHPRGAFVFPPTYAASLNLIEPGWKMRRSLALKGKRFATWEEICAAVSGGRDDVLECPNAHRHPFH